MANTMIDSPTHGLFYFDAVFKAEHERELTLTSHPIQSGAAITDHSYFEPSTVSLEVGYSDAMSAVGEENHSINALTKLEEIMRESEPVSLVTRIKTYRNMIITALSIPDEFAFMYGARASITFQQVEIVYAQIVTVQKKVSSGKSKPKDDEINNDSLPPVDEKTSTLYELNEMAKDWANFDLLSFLGFSRTVDQGSQTVTGSGSNK